MDNLGLENSRHALEYLMIFDNDFICLLPDIFIDMLHFEIMTLLYC